MCANLGVMFEKALIWRIKFEFSLGLPLIFACIALILLSVSFADVGPFRNVLPDELVGVLDVSLLQSVK